MMPERHEFDDDAVCVICGFDGAEWKHLQTPGELQPLCKQGAERKEILRINQRWVAYREQQA